MSQVIALLILLHRADGTEVLINPALVITLQSTGLARGAANTLVNGQAMCVLELIDRRMAAVRESCEAVRQMMEGAR